MNLGFDLDGVLLNSAADLAWLDRGLDNALAELDIEPTESNRRKLYPDALADLEAVAAEFDVEPDRLWATRTRHYTESKVTAIQSGELTPFADLDAIDRLTDETLFCVSNSPQDVVESFLETTGYDEGFDVAVGRGQSREALDRLKPDPAMFDPVADALGDGAYVYVGDRDSDREFAARTGMGYVHLDRRERTLAEAVETIKGGTWEQPANASIDLSPSSESR
ncbi:Phosphoglycolate phosphatase protein [Halorhabdus tiamatea SARL4B]|uniref:Haloacid dehalogenase domain protein hydrolase n=1 Tax=Halorhabdus tiamatea SARL4B TaxID=1033806 RepID=F7PNG2_9EURY|nr:HAD family hydrolase [Halorhabdus tiamatea]ERJ06239.1 Phosphoglycolate phosphatase protein [Halorhabdus tiamatea SARL4B]CCQ33799.1 haloacid dehalogenase domain protein hydrolase [Halorhabdus tiamatea SARL4B]